MVEQESLSQEQLKEALRVAEAKLSTVFNSSHAGIIMVDAYGIIIDANRRMAELFGYSQDELIGSGYTSHVHPDERGVGDVRMRRLISGEIDSVAYERHYIRKDGTDFWGFLSGRRNEDDSGRLVSLVGHVIDISDQKHAEKQLREKECYLQAIIDTSPECIKLLGPDGSLVMMNRAGLKMIDAESLEQVKGQCIYPMVVERDRPAFIELTESIFCGKTGMLEFEAIGLGGRHIWLETHAVPYRNSNNEIIALLGVTRDITSRKQVEQVLHANQEFLDNIVENIPNMIFVKDAAELRFVKFNRAGEEMLGIPRQDLIGKNDYDFFSREEADHFTIRDREVLAGLKVLDIPEEPINTKDGPKLLHTRKIAVMGQDGAPAYLVGISEDITEKKQAEEERRYLEQQLLHAQKLESLGVLAGGIAHDFNNILMAIIGNADLALMRINKESPAADNLRRIEQAAARAADLARQMLAYSGKGHFVVENLDLNILLEEMLHMLEVSISKKVELSFNLARPLPHLEGDATQLRQVVMNLVINASEAIGDETGVIAITTGSMECDRKSLREISLDENLDEGRYVCLQITDSGCGMDQETMARIFDPFFTTKFTGRGLGMAAVLGIVRGHKGGIRVSSEPGRGTCFKILLPASMHETEEPKHVPLCDDWHGSGTVLLVDDEDVVRSIGAEMLRELGFAVITAIDGLDAIEKFRAHPDISLVMLDLTMPRMDGEQCWHELRRLSPTLKVVISSGYSEQEVSRRFSGMGVASFVQKPYKMALLKETLKLVV